MPTPAGVTLVWFPGMNIRRCAEPITRYDAAVAQVLPHDVRTAPVWTTDTYACPMDVAMGVVLYFTYTGRPHAQTVTVSLTGCSASSAPGRGPRLELGNLATHLRPLAPPGMPGFTR